MEEPFDNIFKKFSPEQLKLGYNIAEEIYQIFQTIDILNFNNLSYDVKEKFLRKISTCYYQFTGDEDEIITDINEKMNVFSDLIEKTKVKIVESKKLDSFEDSESLKGEMYVEICSVIIFAIFANRKD